VGNGNIDRWELAVPPWRTYVPGCRYSIGK
jgi:hypothetical protein